MDIIDLDNLISDRYLSDGITKQGLLQFLSGSRSYLSKTEIIVTKFELKGNIVKYEGVMKGKYFEFPLNNRMLIKENGKWKMYGNQNP